MGIIEVEKAYKELIDFVSEKNIDLEVLNSSLIHAKYVLMKLLGMTHTDLNIYYDDLGNELFSDSEFVESLNSKKLIKINILLDKPKMENVKKFKSSLKNKNVVIKENSISTPYFIVSDSQRYRLSFEHDHTRAKVNFNNKSIAETLIRIFKEGLKVGKMI